jgi:hypothetical protein
MHGQIFISYRRDDSSSAAGRIYDRLDSHFSPDKDAVRSEICEHVARWISIKGATDTQPPEAPEVENAVDALPDVPAQPAPVLDSSDT